MQEQRKAVTSWGAQRRHTDEDTLRLEPWIWIRRIFSGQKQIQRKKQSTDRRTQVKSSTVWSLAPGSLGWAAEIKRPQLGDLSNRMYDEFHSSRNEVWDQGVCTALVSSKFFLMTSKKACLLLFVFTDSSPMPACDWRSPSSFKSHNGLSDLI